VGGSFSRSGGTFTSQTASTTLLTSTSSQSHALAGSSFANFAVNDRLIAYWKLDESADGSGAAGLDASGWRHHVTYTSTPTHTTTTATTTFANPYALSVAKVTGATYGEYAELASYPETLKPSTWTISAWIKMNAAAGTTRAPAPPPRISPRWWPSKPASRAAMHRPAAPGATHHRPRRPR
jgi:hypothetical protein